MLFYMSIQVTNQVLLYNAISYCFHVDLSCFNVASTKHGFQKFRVDISEMGCQEFSNGGCGKLDSNNGLLYMFFCIPIDTEDLIFGSLFLVNFAVA